jgi:uncharacterized protein (DUF885 family)
VNRRTFVHRATAAAAGFGILRTFGACREAVPDHDRAFIDLRDRYFIRHLELNPVTSTYLGGDGYSGQLIGINGRLRDYSAAALDTELRFYGNTRDALRVIDAGTLSPALRIDHQVLGAQLDYLIRYIDPRRYHLRAVDTYVAEPFRGVDWQIQQMKPAEGDLLGTEDEWELVIVRTMAIPAYLDTARNNLMEGKHANIIADWRMIQRDGIAGSRANAEYFAKTLVASARTFLGNRSFAAPIVERLTQAGAGAAQAYERFASSLDQSFAPTDRTDRFAAGQEEYDWRVRNVLRDPRSAELLFAYGAQETERYTQKIMEVAKLVSDEAKLGLPFGSQTQRYTSVRKVMEHLSSDSPKSDDELFQWYRDAGARAVAYGREQKLFDVPDSYELAVVPTPPVLRSTIDAAYYPAPPLKRSGVGRFYLTPTGNDPAALKLNNRASVADTAIHEGFPGHDWHFRYMTEHGEEISNIRWLTPGAVEDSSSMWSDSMATEGWGLYSEELMAEPAPGRPFGFYSAGEYLYELQGQLLRTVRVRVDVGIHTSRMSYDEAIDYFTEHVSFYPKACARAASDPAARAICESANRAIYRYSKWPSQAITYNLGKNQIIELREAYKAKRAGSYTSREFHERFMRAGTIPVGYFREHFLADEARATA